MPQISQHNVVSSNHTSPPHTNTNVLELTDHTGNDGWGVAKISNGILILSSTLYSDDNTMHT